MSDSCAVNTINRLSYLSGINENNSQFNNGSILIVADKRITIIYSPECNPNNYFVYDASCNKRYLISSNILSETLEKFNDCATIQAVSMAQMNSITRSYNLIAPPILFCELNRNEKCSTTTVNRLFPCGPYPSLPSASNPSSCGSCNTNCNSCSGSSSCGCKTCCQSVGGDWGPAFTQDSCNPCGTGCNVLDRCGRSVYRHISYNTNCFRCTNSTVKQLSYGTYSTIALPRCSNSSPCSSCGCSGCAPQVVYYGQSNCANTSCVGTAGPQGPPGPQGAAFTPDIITSQNLFELTQTQLAQLGDGYSWLYTIDQKMYFLVEQDNGVFIWTEGYKIVGPVGSQGVQGCPGLNGLPGDQGPVGPPGPAGPAFQPNEVGLRDPASFTQAELAAFGDGYAYLYILNGYLYFVISSGSPTVYSWSAGYPIVGQTGAAGSAGATGATGPAGATGSQGAAFTVDLYLDTSPYDLTPTDLEVYYNAGIRSILWTQNGNLFFIRYIDGVYTLSCPLGLVGPQGLEGPVGPVGQPGATGSAGARGSQGVTGYTGATGPTGSKGDVGAAFQPNLIGQRDISTFTQYELMNFAVGFAYLWIDTGLLYFVVESGGVYSWSAGYPIVGPTGTSGSQGNIGPTGAQGIQGPTGIGGTPGSTGSQGATGPRGQQGVQGCTGSRGLQGPAYTPDLITDKLPTEFTQRDLACLGVTTSVLFTQTGSMRFVECDSTTHLFYFGEEFPIVGPEGEPGPVGPTGMTGSTGADGPPGVGVPGPPGPPGPTGTEGDSIWSMVDQMALLGSLSDYFYSISTVGSELSMDASNTLDPSASTISISKLNPSATFVVYSVDSTLQYVTAFDITSTSDIRKKKILGPLFEEMDAEKIALKPVSMNTNNRGSAPKAGWKDKLLDLNAVRFNYLTDPTNREKIGYVAQELIEKGFQNLVHTDKDGYYSVSYDKFCLYLIEGMREMNEEMKDMKSKIDYLMSKVG